MKSAEVKGLSTKELKERADAEAASLDQMKINHSISPLDSPAKIKQLRRTVARLKTELRQREEQTNN
ncbi:MAG: 50S ribosomal protein L29 [Tannerella sp.]|jgi:large subunit ribosomal protein L29|nr:50S ribosomal protein L29 [Tannerella sp.]